MWGWIGVQVLQTKLHIIVVQTPMKYKIQKSSTARVHNCTCSREGERVDGVQVAEPAPRRSVAAPPLERRKPQSYFLFSQFFGFKTCSEHFIGYIYSCRICSLKCQLHQLSRLLPPWCINNMHFYNLFNLVRKSSHPNNIIKVALSFWGFSSVL